MDPVSPQVNRFQEEKSRSLDVGEFNENIEKLTKLLTNMTIARAGRRMDHVKCFFCDGTGHIALYYRSDVQRHNPKSKYRLYVKAAQEKILRAAGEQPAYVKLDMEYESLLDMDDVLKMREAMVPLVFWLAVFTLTIMESALHFTESHIYTHKDFHLSPWNTREGRLLFPFRAPA